MQFSWAQKRIRSKCWFFKQKEVFSHSWKPKEGNNSMLPLSSLSETELQNVKIFAVIFTLFYKSLCIYRWFRKISIFVWAKGTDFAATLAGLKSSLCYMTTNSLDLRFLNCDMWTIITNVTVFALINICKTVGGYLRCNKHSILLLPSPSQYHLILTLRFW